MPTKSISNFLTKTGNTNDFSSFLTTFSSAYKSEGIIDGFFVKGVGAANSVQIAYSATENAITNSIIPGDTNKQILGFAAVTLNNIMRPVWEQGTTTRNISFIPNTTSGIVFSLVCIKINDNNKTVNIVFEPGTAGQDPELNDLETAGIKYLPLARVRQPANQGAINQSDIDVIGTCNTGDFRPIGIKAVPRSNKGFRVINQNDENTLSFDKGDVWYNPDTENFSAFNGGITNIKNSKILYQLNSSVALGTYTAVSTTSGTGVNTIFAPVVRSTEGTVFDDILSGATGIGNLTLLANSLKVGDEITISGTIQSTTTTINANQNIQNNAQIFVRFGGSPGTWLNNIDYRTTVIPNVQTGYAGFLSSVLGQGGANVANVVFPNPISSIFRLTGTVTKIGAAGQIMFSESGGSVYLLNNTTWSVAGRNSGVGNCQPTTIDTTISNTLNIDFRVYKTGGGNFSPTYTLNNLTIYKN